MSSEEILDLHVKIDDPKIKMLILRAMKANVASEVIVALSTTKKMKGTDSTFPVGMYGQQTDDGLNVLQSFAMNAPDIIPEWFKGESTKPWIERKEDRYFQWRIFYAKRMIEELNKHL